MGKTYIQSFLNSHIVRPSEVILLEHSDSKKEDLARVFPIQIETQAGAFLADADWVVLAVKPQDTGAMYAQIQPFLSPNQVVLSIMAGIKVASLQAALGIPKIIRAMPNLPAQIGMGMTAFTASDALDKSELIKVQNLLGTTGVTLYFEKEEMIDAATAISGSGPAFVYYFMNALIQAGTSLGFTASESELLVWQTFLGAIHLHNRNSLSCEEWIQKVASKGGTTEAALNVFNAQHLAEIIQAGIVAADARAKALGN